MLVAILKVFGLSGIGRNGWITLAITAALLAMPTVIPAVKAKIPYFGTEAKLKRVRSDLADKNQSLVQCRSDYQSAQTASDDLADRFSSLNSKLAAQAERVETLTRLAADRENRLKARQTDDRKRLDETLEALPWADVVVPADVVVSLQRAAD